MIDLVIVTIQDLHRALLDSPVRRAWPLSALLLVPTPAAAELCADFGLGLQRGEWGRVLFFGSDSLYLHQRSEIGYALDQTVELLEFDAPWWWDLWSLPVVVEDTTPNDPLISFVSRECADGRIQESFVLNIAADSGSGELARASWMLAVRNHAGSGAFDGIPGWSGGLSAHGSSAAYPAGDLIEPIVNAWSDTPWLPLDRGGRAAVLGISIDQSFDGDVRWSTDFWTRAGDDPDGVPEALLDGLLLARGSSFDTELRLLLQRAIEGGFNDRFELDSIRDRQAALGDHVAGNLPIDIDLRADHDPPPPHGLGAGFVSFSSLSMGPERALRIDFEGPVEHAGEQVVWAVELLGMRDRVLEARYRMTPTEVNTLAGRRARGAAALNHFDENYDALWLAVMAVEGPDEPIPFSYRAADVAEQESTGFTDLSHTVGGCAMVADRTGPGLCWVLLAGACRRRHRKITAPSAAPRAPRDCPRGP